jgi:multiple sugar transport system substrate-binding protein
MFQRNLTRREMLRILGIGSAGAVLAACAPAVPPQVIKETVEVPVEKVVQQTVEVPKIVQQTVEVVVTPTPAPEGPVTIEFWHDKGDLDGQVMDSLVAEWNAANPDIQVKATYTPNITSAGTNPKFLAAALSGNPPDVFIHDGSSFSTSTNLNAFMAIDDLVKASKLDPTAFFPWAWEKVQWNGHAYGLPLDTDARALYYNKALLEKAGFAEPPKTIDELDAMAEKLTVKSGDRIDTMGFIPWIGNWFLIAWGWDWGLKVWDAATNKINLNGKEMVDALTWEVGYANKYGVSSIQNFQQGFGSGADNPFRNGTVAMELTGNWEILSLKNYVPDLQYGISPAPYPAGRAAMTWSGGFVTGIPQGSKHPNQAWQFVYWLGAGDGASKYAIQTQHLPTNVAAAKAFADATPAQKIFVDLLPVSFIEPVIPEWSLAWDTHLAAEQEALFGQKTPQEALDAANAKVQEAIDIRLQGG